MSAALAGTLVGLGLVGAFVAGLLGVGGAIVMVPLLLYGPPLLGLERLDVKAVAGVTMVQVLVAAMSGMVAHRRYRAVNAALSWVAGLAMAAGSFVGALSSKYVSDESLLAVFAVMATAATALMLKPLETVGEPIFADQVQFDRRRAIAVAASVGVGAGLVGAGGAFLLVPLMLFVVGIPIRVTIGSSLAITALAATAGVIGKLATGQVPFGAAVAVAVGAIPGAQLGAALSRRLPGSRLKLALTAVTLASALRVWWDLLKR